MNETAKAIKRISLLLMLMALLSARFAPAAESPVGKWNTLDQKTGKVTSEVEIYEQSGKLFGKIVALPEPNDKQGKPKTCIKCPGADKDKPIVGLVFLKGFGPSGDHYKGGTILDPEDGKVYTAEIWVEDGKLKVRGYVGFFYQTRTWIKAG